VLWRDGDAVRGTRRYTHTRTHLMRVRVCVWVRDRP